MVAYVQSQDAKLVFRTGVDYGRSGCGRQAIPHKHKAPRRPLGRQGIQEHSLTAVCVKDGSLTNKRDCIAVTQTRLSDRGLLE